MSFKTRYTLLTASLINLVKIKFSSWYPSHPHYQFQPWNSFALGRLLQDVSSAHFESSIIISEHGFRKCFEDTFLNLHFNLLHRSISEKNLVWRSGNNNFLIDCPLSRRIHQTHTNISPIQLYTHILYRCMHAFVHPFFDPAFYILCIELSKYQFSDPFRRSINRVSPKIQLSIHSSNLPDDQFIKNFPEP